MTSPKSISSTHTGQSVLSPPSSLLPGICLKCHWDCIFPSKFSHWLFTAYRIKFKHLSLLFKVPVPTAGSYLYSWRRLLLTSVYWPLSCKVHRKCRTVVLFVYTAIVLNLSHSRGACISGLLDNMIISIHIHHIIEIRNMSVYFCSPWNIYENVFHKESLLVKVTLVASRNANLFLSSISDGGVRMVFCSTWAFRDPHKWWLRHLQHAASNFAFGIDRHITDVVKRRGRGRFHGWVWEGHIPLTGTQSMGLQTTRKTRKSSHCVVGRRRNGFGD